MEDRCVSCGEIIPEGRRVCESCEKGERKFTDDEVIKALMYCTGIKKLDACANCPMCLGCNDCVDLLREEALDLINRQRATIERMAKLVEGFEENCNTAIKIIDRWEKAYASAKAEAIKEFAERLCEGRVSNDPVVIATQCLLKGMTEVKCKDCEHLELELPYAVCSKAYKGMVNPDDSCGKGKRKRKQGNEN